MNTTETSKQDKIEKLLQILDDEIQAGLDADAFLNDVDLEQNPPPVHNVDLVTLLAEMAALKSEIRKETQAARLLRDDNQRCIEVLTEALQRAESRFQSVASELAELRAQKDMQLAKSLIDVVDRLEPALTQIQELTKVKRRKWWRPRKPDPRLMSLAEGLAITFRHIHQCLEDRDVRLIETQNRYFDPLLMEAVGSQTRRDCEDGMVIREVLVGYLYNGKPLRPAKVIVSRNKKSDDPRPAASSTSILEKE